MVTEDKYNRHHHPWGVPQGGYGDGACILSQQAYVSLYSNSLNTPLWAGYTLDPQVSDRTSVRYLVESNDKH